MTNIESVAAKAIIEKAMEAMEKSYSPYSNFKVGASILGADGVYYSGCNVENAALGPSNCAERTAIFKAVSEGCREFLVLCVVGGKNGEITDYCPPCGTCRQVLSEFCDDDFPVILAKSTDDYKIMTLGQLLPERFSL